MASPGDESQKFPERHADGACPQPRDRAARLEPAKRGQSFFLFEKSIALLLGKAYSLNFFCYGLSPFFVKVRLVFLWTQACRLETSDL